MPGRCVHTDRRNEPSRLIVVAPLLHCGGGRRIYPSPHSYGGFMASTPEVKVKKQIRKILDEAGAYYAMPIGTGYGNSGVPDFLICHRGRFIAVEAKAGSNKPTALQEAHMARIRKEGGSALVINETNMNQLKEILT